jgi:PAS domain S-box-containing protein
LCWRVTLSVFLSILIVEAIILIPSFKNYERDLLRRLEDAGLAAISAGLGSHIGASHSHMLEIGEAILSSPRVRGGALYDGKGTLVGSFGEIPELTPAQARQPGKARVRRDGGARYEVSWTSADSGLPFNVVGRLDASWIDGELTDFLWRIAGLVFMISVFVSGVAILILGRLILGPMLELRSKMVAARDDPANADLYKIEMTRRDELGDMVEALNNLLHSVSQTRRDELKAREERFRDFAGAASDWFWEMDEDLRFSYFSQRFQEITGVAPEMLLGKRREDSGIAPDVDPEVWRQHLDDLAAHRPFRNFVHPRTHPDGRVVHLSINGKPIFDRDGNFLGYRGTGTEITAEVEARREAAEAQTRLMEAIEAQSDAFALFDAEDRLVLCNRRFRDFHPTHADAIIAGATFESQLRIGLERAAFPDAVGREEAWLAERMAHHRKDESTLEQRLANGRWHRITERRTKDGGTVGVRTDITELKAREAELQVAKEEAEAANRAKSEFLANMSHELRTPLNAIIGFSDLMLDGVGVASNNERFLEYAKDINDSGRHLLDVINDILDLSKIEAGKFELHETTVDIEALVRSILHLVEGRANEVGLDLGAEFGADLPWLWVDERAIKQICLNLLSNAVKFTPPGGRVTVRVAAADEGGLTIAVNDTGIGIASQNIEKVQEPFSQVDSIFSRKFPGTGLGLPLVKLLAEMHDGVLALDSEVDVGTTATICFPEERVRRMPQDHLPLAAAAP